MAINKEVVDHVAYLARIRLSDEETVRLAQQLEGIVAFIDALKNVNVEHISPTSHILPVQNVLRDDVPVRSLPIDKVLVNAPQPEGDFFGVPKIIE
ncbi:MAG: Asp-tRNA(Asn)/Glu-tRNA(Gln) amidotransferase subunit GatC [Candidatus Omnitrophica bacterium]|nr:Asp-tRNA(Asn)/Glu-tRNA(Gln) amidotransferase subunit GatC [Candidatus Omnitrophota bacterium]